MTLRLQICITRKYKTPFVDLYCIFKDQTAWTKVYIYIFGNQLVYPKLPIAVCTKIQEPILPDFETCSFLHMDFYCIICVVICQYFILNEQWLNKATFNSWSLQCCVHHTMILNLAIFCIRNQVDRVRNYQLHSGKGGVRK